MSKTNIGPLTIFKGSGKKGDNIMQMLSTGYPSSKIHHITEFTNGDLKPMGSVAIWGILRGAHKIIDWSKTHKKNFVYMDNYYFEYKESMYRFCINSPQIKSIKNTDPKRFKELNIEIEPWVTNKRHVVVCPPTDIMMKYYKQEDWLSKTLSKLIEYTDRPIKIRQKPNQKIVTEKKSGYFPVSNKVLYEQSSTLKEDLENAHAVVTFNSNVAIWALTKGIPAFTSKYSSGCLLGNTDLRNIETPILKDRRPLFYQLANSQFTKKELSIGLPWKYI